jgi:hypothetical protein
MGGGSEGVGNGVMRWVSGVELEGSTEWEMGSKSIGMVVLSIVVVGVGVSVVGAVEESGGGEETMRRVSSSEEEEVSERLGGMR